MKRIYVCHTFYHVYVSMLKELALPKDEQGNATIVLSRMSTKFEDLKDRLEALNYFQAVYEMDEKSFDQFPELERYHVKTGNFVKALINRIIFTRKLAKLQEPGIPVDFRAYDEVYVFCDSDPIGIYLAMNHIYYHAVEDGLNMVASNDCARIDNEGHFEFKVFLAKKLNLIHIQNGYSKYCKDMEVNDISILKYPNPYYVEVSRAKLEARLTQEDKNLMLKAFVRNIDKLEALVSTHERPTVMILTEPLCDLVTRRQIFQDFIDRYKDDYDIIMKPHPRDYLDYEKEFPDQLIIDKTVPMEMLDFIPDFSVDLIVTVFTHLENIKFAKKKLRMGRDYMDQYEDPEIHKPRFESLGGGQ